jgi:hypothetical protein
MLLLNLGMVSCNVGYHKMSQKVFINTPYVV